MAQAVDPCLSTKLLHAEIKADAGTSVYGSAVTLGRRSWLVESLK